MFGWIVGREARNARQLDDLHRLVLEQTGRLDTFAHQQQILTALATRLALVERSTPALVAIAPTGASPPACECPAAAAVREPTPGALVVAPAEAAAALVHTRQLFEGALTRGDGPNRTGQTSAPSGGRFHQLKQRHWSNRSSPPSTWGRSTFDLCTGTCSEGLPHGGRDAGALFPGPITAARGTDGHGWIPAVRPSAAATSGPVVEARTHPLPATNQQQKICEQCLLAAIHGMHHRTWSQWFPSLRIRLLLPGTTPSPFPS